MFCSCVDYTVVGVPLSQVRNPVRGYSTRNINDICIQTNFFGVSGARKKGGNQFKC